MTVKLPETLTDHPSLVGIIRFPCKTYCEFKEVTIPIIQNDLGIWKSVNQTINFSTLIESNTRASSIYNVPKANITDFYPYTYFLLTDGETEPLLLKPQYLPNAVQIECEIALSHQPVEKYYIPNYKGDTNGRNYNIINTSQMMLPCATNEGMNYLSSNANTIAQSRKNLETSNFLNATIGIVNTISSMSNPISSIYSGINGISNMINGMNNLKQVDARNEDLTLTPSGLKSFGTPSTRDKFDNNKVRLLKYTVSDEVKNKINGFCNRYGNKYNGYGSIDIKTYKGFIKMVDVHILSAIDNIHLAKIKEILERGVYIE